VKRENYQRWIGKWKKRMEEAEEVEAAACSGRTPE